MLRPHVIHAPGLDPLQFDFARLPTAEHAQAHYLIATKLYQSFPKLEHNRAINKRLVTNFKHMTFAFALSPALFPACLQAARLFLPSA